MFVTLRLYRLNPIFEREFIRLWNELVVELKALDALEQAVLHKESKISYVSYVNWTTSEAHEEMSNNPPHHIRRKVEKVQECCNSITLLHRMEVIDKTIMK
ncbi:MAG TPA: hypothetical protein DCG19_05830 [Cryomorphaceae bacterium]|nr:hypothetical protein [Owenweeksia sp.]MBF99719.1 hypothetical protein [Owenweeksia sp.]HAD96905.1 hypothetical protein [Cryomorphaceae bacterium]HBF19217.1 hypothetical protein [Cryomorphaceae bacterium]HCQ15084.1 hypothetical protein [Cryomorphaceae bacterium]|tara:strand:- start:168 stop:470 length:303 start_codon:yes stop_codon:yes gene_type:complete